MKAVKEIVDVMSADHKIAAFHSLAVEQARKRNMDAVMCMTAEKINELEETIKANPEMEADIKELILLTMYDDVVTFATQKTECEDNLKVAQGVILGYICKYDRTVAQLKNWIKRTTTLFLNQNTAKPNRKYFDLIQI